MILLNLVVQIMRLQLPCQPKAFYYMRRRYGDVLQLPGTDKGSRFALNALCHFRNAAYDYVQDAYAHSMPIDLANWVFFQYGVETPNPMAVCQINAYMEEKFEEDFFLQMHELIYVSKPGMKMIKAIYHLQEEWGIDEEVITVDALKKAYYRYRKRKPEIFEKSTSEIVPVVRTNQAALDERIEIRIDAALKAKLQSLCERKRVPVSRVMYSLIENYLQHA